MTKADKERIVILAEAYKLAEILKGEGDAEATSVYAKAFDKDPEFYEFSEDYEFNHPTPAVCVIRGGRMNGHYEWKLASDPSMNYGDWKDHNS